MHFYLYENHDFTFWGKLSFNKWPLHDRKPLGSLLRLIDKDMEAQTNPAHICHKLMSWIWIHVYLAPKSMLFLSQCTAFSLNVFSTKRNTFLFFKKNAFSFMFQLVLIFQSNYLISKKKEYSHNHETYGSEIWFI